MTTWRKISRDELAESLIFYRRRLAGQLAREIVRETVRNKGALGTQYASMDAIAADAEDLAHFLTRRLAARETGDPDGYR